MTRSYGRSHKGKRVYGSKAYYRGENITLIGAIALKGVLGVMTVNSGLE